MNEGNCLVQIVAKEEDDAEEANGNIVIKEIV